MGSEYALPPPRRNHGHAHSHSYAGIQLSPDKTTANSFAKINGSANRSPQPNGLLFTHAESSRETSPVGFPNGNHTHSKHLAHFEQNVYSSQENTRASKHKHNHSEPSIRQSRSGRESDIGRPSQHTASAYRPSLESIPAASPSWFSLPEALTSMLVTFPCILASAAYSSMSGLSTSDFPPLARYMAVPQPSVPEMEGLEPQAIRKYGFIDACILTSGTLLVVGIFAKMQRPERVYDKDKQISRTLFDIKTLWSGSGLRSMALRTLSLWLPFYASMLLGGSRVGLVLLVAIAADLICSDEPRGTLLDQWRTLWASKVGTSVVVLLSFIVDEIGLTIRAPLTDVLLGYLALATSILVLPPPLPTLAFSSPTRQISKRSSPVTSSDPLSRRGSASNTAAVSYLACSSADVDITLCSGILLAAVTVLASALLSYSPSISTSSLILITFAIASMASAILFSRPPTLRSQSKAGLALGCFLTASSSFLFSPSLWPGTVCNGGLSGLSFFGILYDTYGHHNIHNDDHDHVHHSHTRTHHRHQHHQGVESSAFTQFLLAQCEPGSVVFGILSEKDSRRIAYFTTLNFGYMLIQGAYGYLSGSLGLLSDTVHMFFDCLGLVVGLGAAIASKWPTSPERPYGWGKLNTLSGFGNGIFLMLVSVEFIWEAIEGLLEKRELRHVQELLVVSVLGLLVNIVGLVFFHSHAGHDHGHDHSHGHSHEHVHGHSHEHSHSNGHLRAHSDSHGHSHKHSPEDHHSHAHSHSHGNENLHGIFLHIAADAGGSLAVILSTALNIWRPSFLWDPLATILIAILIFAAAVPLVTSSARKLLLVVPDELAYQLKNTLQDLGELRGVVGYSTPRFWVDDSEKDPGSEDHAHSGCNHSGKNRIIGVIHVIAAPSADLKDVQERVEAFLAERNMNIVIQVERDEAPQFE